MNKDFGFSDYLIAGSAKPQFSHHLFLTGMLFFVVMGNPILAVIIQGISNDGVVMIWILQVVFD